jgi:copper(I)-binding protein
VRLAPVRRRLATVAAASLLPLVLTACGAGLQAQTYQFRNQWSATNAAIGALAVRNLSVLPPSEGMTYEPGEDAEVRFTIVNDGSEEDRLLEITSDAASSVEVQVAGEQGEVTLPPLSSTGQESGAVLRGITRPLRTGEYVEMTLRFEVNGVLEVLVPIEPAPEIGTRSTADNWEHETDVLQRGLMGTADEHDGEEGEGTGTGTEAGTPAGAGTGGGGTPGAEDPDDLTGSGSEGESQGTGAAAGEPTGGEN